MKYWQHPNILVSKTLSKTSRSELGSDYYLKCCSINSWAIHSAIDWIHISEFVKFWSSILQFAWFSRFIFAMYGHNGAQFLFGQCWQKENNVCWRGADIQSVSTQKHAQNVHQYGPCAQMHSSLLWATAIAALMNIFTLSSGCPAQCLCKGWSNPCEVCTLTEKENHYVCLARGRNGGEKSCVAGNGGVTNVTCVWEQGQGSNFWSGGSNQCVIARSACCESSDANGRCFQLGQPVPSAISTTQIASVHVVTAYTVFLILGFSTL